MNLCMTDLKGIQSRLFGISQGMVASELVKRPSSSFAVSSNPAKKPAPSPLVPPNSNSAPSGPSPPTTNAMHLAKILSDPKRALEKQRQKLSLQQVHHVSQLHYPNFFFVEIRSDSCFPQAASQRKSCLYAYSDCPHFDTVQLVPALPSLSSQETHRDS